jgi:hypothetical protein
MSKAAEPADHRRSIALIPFVLAGIAFIAATAAFFVTGWSRNVGAILCGVSGAVLVFDIPVCVWVLIDWIRTGQPPELNLSPLIPSREEREFHRRLRERPKLNDDEFYETYFAAANVPREVPVRLRRLLENEIGLDLGGVHPDDNLTWADSELDFADVLYLVEDEFHVAIRIEGFAFEDCTLGSLVQLIAQAHALVAGLDPETDGWNPATSEWRDAGVGVVSGPRSAVMDNRRPETTPDPWTARAPNPGFSAKSG